MFKKILLSFLCLSMLISQYVQPAKYDRHQFDAAGNLVHRQSGPEKYVPRADSQGGRL